MIKDQLGYGLKILFIGINPHPGSYRRGVPFSNNKMFWYLLSAAGLLSEDREFLKDDVKLKHFYENVFKKKYKFGLINLVNSPSRTVAEINKKEIVPGRERIIAAIKRYKPKVVCFVGKINYILFSGNSSASFGWQTDIGESKVYIAHAPHRGLASVRIKDFKEIYKMATKL
jgi:TDG/mug DNA glycosylase family protein